MLSIIKFYLKHILQYLYECYSLPVESLHEEWDSLAKDVRRETQNSLPAVERSVSFSVLITFIISPSILKHTPVYYISLSQ